MKSFFAAISSLYRTAKPTMCHVRPRVAVFHQALAPPVIGGLSKPQKPGGYQDSGADIAYALQTSQHAEVVLPTTSPDPAKDQGWKFPDTESGIISAVQAGATHLWMNTVLFSVHPIQTSKALPSSLENLHIVGQPPCLAEDYDEKASVNDYLRLQHRFLLPGSVTVENLSDVPATLASAIDKLGLPMVAKPIRGRGSHGVKLCHSSKELTDHVQALLQESSSIMLEQYLAGDEATITVLPPASSDGSYRSLPPVVRFNHHDGVAPYNGIVAVTQNSRTLSLEEIEADHAWKTIMEDCEEAAKLLKCTAPIRIDIRSTAPSGDGKQERFAIFDVNMKPNMTGPGRPGREDQASLSAMAAQAVGWDYPEFLRKILETSKPLNEIRRMRSVFAHD